MEVVENISLTLSKSNFSPVQYWIANLSYSDKNFMGAEQLSDIDRTVQKAMSKCPMVKHYIDLAEVFLGHSIVGKVADLGSGRGSAAAVLAERQLIDKVFAVEYSPNLLENIQPCVFLNFPDVLHKIERICGNFNNLRFGDSSLDAVVELGAFHHSYDIHKTMAETFRTLKPGGVFLGIERSHPDNTEELVLQKLLDKPYSLDWKERYGFPKEAVIRRRDYGEHEYRDCEWLSFMKQAGFQANLVRFLGQPRGKNKQHLSARKILVCIMKPLEKILLKHRVTRYPLPGFGRKSTTLLIGCKPTL